MNKISITTLGSLIEFQRGYDLPKTSFVEGSVPVISSNGILGYHNEYKVKGPGITIGRSGTVGLPHYIEDNFYPHNTSLFIKDFKGNNPKYIYYLLKTLGLNDRGSGSGVPTMNRNHLHPLKVRVYLNTVYQEVIVNILASIDSKIGMNNRINAELEAMAKTVYDYWFVQFDFPNAEGKPYKSSGGKMVWSDELKRKIPEGWETEKMSEWVDIDKSGDWGKEEMEGNFTKKVICFRGADINGLNGLAELKPPVRYILEKNSSKILKSHDLIIEISGGSPTQSTGRLAFITDATIKRFEYPLICSNFCKPISIRNKKLLYNFVYYWNSLYDNGVFFGYEGKTSGIKNLLLDSFLSSYSTVVPDEKVVNQFYDMMESIQEKKQTALSENQQLSSLRDWLLPMLMNGQVSVGEQPLASASGRTGFEGEQEEEWCGGMVAEEIPTYKLPVRSNIPDNKKGFAKQVLGGKIVKEFKNDKNFTHIKFQKLQYLAEQIIEENLDWNYYRQSAGPYDNKFMHTVFYRLEKNNWFKKCGNNYQPLGKVNDIDKYYQNYFGDKSDKLNKLFSLLQKGTEKFCEAVATIYAVWNNHIILKQEFDKERVKTDFFDWSNRKTIVFTEEEFEKALVWMQNHEIVPTGFGNLIKEKK